MAEVYVCVTLSDGTVAHVAFQTTMRCAVHPGGPWSGPDANGLYHREVTTANIEYELARAARHWQLDGKTTVGWRVLTQEEHEFFNRDRDYRNAIQDVGGKLGHDLAKARELHRAVLRHWNGDRLLTLDREWVDHMANNDLVAARAVEAKRKALRDLVHDPRIDAAQTLEELKAVIPVEGEDGRTPR